MNEALVDKIANAVLYEGYILYPYRRSTKNTQRWTFGGIFPRGWSESEPHAIQTQCLIRGSDRTKLTVKVRFLQLVDRRIRTPSLDFIDEIEIAGKRYQSWQEAVERSVSIETTLADAERKTGFRFPASESIEPLSESDGREVASLVRRQSAIEGSVEFSAKYLRDDVFQITVRVTNQTPIDRTISRDAALLHSMASTHIVLAADGGAFVSLIDPPPDLADLARQCKNDRAWPVLVGETGETDCVLAAPIILYDYPQIAPESPGDLFDGTEIDEILSLRIMTLSDEEKRNAADLDDRAANLLSRTQSLAREQLMRLHGTMRPPRRIEAVHVGDAEVRVGDHVRLNPGRGADAFDIILRGKTATIAAIEQDYENRIHLAVTIDDDPGAYIGAAGKIGHRFFFRPEEVEPIRAAQEASA